MDMVVCSLQYVHIVYITSSHYCVRVVCRRAVSQECMQHLWELRGTLEKVERSVWLVFEAPNVLCCKYRYCTHFFIRLGSILDCRMHLNFRHTAIII